MAHIVNGMREEGDPEYRRLETICGPRPRQYGSDMDKWANCMQSNARPLRHPITTLHAGPTETSEVLATVFEQRRFTDNGDSELTWNIARTSAPSVVVPWPESREVFDYGLHVAGVQREGEWVRLLGSIPVDGWLRITESPSVPDRARARVYVEDLEGQIVELRRVQATWPDGSFRRIGAGSYLIRSIGRAGVEFRAEIPSDFDCGEPVMDPAPLPPLLRASVADLFDSDGGPRFFKSHTKGC